MATKTSRPLRKGDRVVATEPFRGVPESTAGKVRMIVGVEWIRAWVQFDNGVWLGSIGVDKLVSEDGWHDFQVQRTEEEIRAAARAEQAAAEPPPSEAAAPTAAEGPTSRIPAHLLERSKAARAKTAANG